jgi:hypothetical protein
MTSIHNDLKPIFLDQVPQHFNSLLARMTAHQPSEQSHIRLQIEFISCQFDVFIAHAPTRVIAIVNLEHSGIDRLARNR